MISQVSKTVAKQDAVRLVVVGKSSSASSGERLVVDAGRTSGDETAHQGGAKITVKVTPAGCYFAGNTTGLKNMIGLTAAQAKTVGSRWVSLAKKSTQCTNLASDVSLHLIDTMLPTAKGTTLSHATVHGQHRDILRWVTAATSTAPKLTTTLVVTHGNRALPLKETTKAATGDETVLFSHWGERIVVHAPAAHATIAYTKVTA